jgi:hypothetical protein
MISREEREKKLKKIILKAYRNFNYNTINLIEKNLNEMNSITLRNVIINDSSVLYLPPKDNG